MVRPLTIGRSFCVQLPSPAFALPPLIDHSPRYPVHSTIDEFFPEDPFHRKPHPSIIFPFLNIHLPSNTSYTFSSTLHLYLIVAYGPFISSDYGTCKVSSFSTEPSHSSSTRPTFHRIYRAIILIWMLPLSITSDDTKDFYRYLSTLYSAHSELLYLIHHQPPFPNHSPQHLALSITLLLTRFRTNSYQTRAWSCPMQITLWLIPSRTRGTLQLRLLLRSRSAICKHLFRRCKATLVLRRGETRAHPSA